MIMLFCDFKKLGIVLSLVTLFLFALNSSLFAFTAKVQTTSGQPLAGVGITFSSFDTTAYTDVNGFVSFTHVVSVNMKSNILYPASLRMINKKIYVELPKTGDVDVKLFTILGRRVYSIQQVAPPGKFVFQLPYIASGIYILKARLGNSIFVKKVNPMQECVWQAFPLKKLQQTMLFKKNKICDTAIFTKSDYYQTRRSFVNYSDNLGVVILDSTGIEGGAKSVYSGTDHTIFLKQDNTLWGVGSNYLGQFGIKNSSSTSTPVQIMEGVSAVSVAGNHTMVIKPDGSLWGMGENNFGQLGTADVINKNIAEQILAKVIAVSTGKNHTIAIRSDSSLWGMGNNDFGQLGDGTDTTRNFPTKGNGSFVTVSCGDYHSMLLKNDNTLWGCGQNYYGQLGDGTLFEKHVPVLVMSNVLAVSSGDCHTMIIRQDNSLWATGDNTFGQLGDGTYSNKSKPVQIMAEVASVSAGSRYTMVLKMDGSLWVMGRNEWNQLGTGDSVTRNKPFQIATDVKAVSAGNTFTMILKKNGTLWAAGHGSGFCFSYNPFVVPVKVLPPQSFGLTVCNGIGSGSYLSGSKITCYANDSSSQHRSFFQWGGPDSGYVNYLISRDTFSITMPSADLVVVAKYRDMPNLTVVNGSGSGWYDSAKTVEIIANDSSSSKRSFWRWAGPDSALVKNRFIVQSTIKMSSKPAKIQAFYGSSYDLAVTGGTGSGTYVTGTEVAVSTYDSSIVNRGFDHWGGRDSNLVFNPIGVTSSFTMPDHAVNLTAVFSDNHMLTVNNSFDGGHYVKNFMIKLTAIDSVDSHRHFDHWGGADSARFMDDTLNPSWFSMPGRDAVVTAKYRDMYSVTVNGRETGWYDRNENANVFANDSAFINRAFDHWSGPDSALIVYSDQNINSIVMPKRNVVLIAKYTDMFTLTVTNGKGSGIFYKPTRIDIYPDDSTAVKKVFDHWGGPDSGILNNDTLANTTIFRITKNVTLTAIYHQGYTVTFDKNGGDLDASPSVSPLVSAGRLLLLMPTQPKKKGYFFTGWNTKQDGSGQMFSFMPIVTSDMKVYAQWGTMISRISTGATTSMFILANGVVLGCGDNSSHWLNLSQQNEFTPIPVMENALYATGGWFDQFILKTDNTLWGINCANQFIDGESYVFKKVMSSVAAVSSGSSFTMIVKQDNSLWATGVNSDGQLGCGDTINKTFPIQIMTNVADVKAKNSSTMILKKDNTLWVTGKNDFGQLGLGDKQNRRIPTQLMTDVKSVSEGGGHTMILKLDNTLWGCGNNGIGQLGDGTVINRLSPVKIMDNVLAISAGGKFTMIIKQDSSLWATGENMYGQLGDKTKIAKQVPVCIVSLGKVSVVSTGDIHTIVLKPDGTVWAMGNHKLSQFGNSTVPESSRPIQIP